jgi:release factor glutamine methyltransferase
VHVEVVQTDLMRGVRPTALDRILINPPYLPTSEFEAVPGPLNLAFDAGPDGRRFLPRLAAYLQEARPRLRAGFEAFVVVSSLQGLAWATALWRRHGFAAQSHAQQAMPFETLHLLKVTPMQP